MVSSGIYRTSHCYLDSNPSISQSPSLLKYILVFAALIELYIFFHFQHNYKYSDVLRDFLRYLLFFFVSLQICLHKNTGNGKFEGNAAHWRLADTEKYQLCMRAIQPQLPVAVSPSPKKLYQGWYNFEYMINSYDTINDHCLKKRISTGFQYSANFLPRNN